MTITAKTTIDKQIDKLFSELPTGYGNCVNPVTGGSFVRGEPGPDSIAYQKKEARKLLLARERFAAIAPPDAPPLPVSDYDIDDYRNAGGLKGVVGFYARSISMRDYDTQNHPSFDDFACGLMASNSWLWGIEQDVELRRRFPPRPLAGMTPGLYWAPPKEYEETMASYARSAERACRSAQSGNVEVIAAAPGG